MDRNKVAERRLQALARLETALECLSGRQGYIHDHAGPVQKAFPQMHEMFRLECAADLAEQALEAARKRREK